MAHWRHDNRIDDEIIAANDAEVKRFTDWAVSLATTLSAIFLIVHFGI
jgi:hypothetical protein